MWSLIRSPLNLAKKLIDTHMVVIRLNYLVSHYAFQFFLAVVFLCLSRGAWKVKKSMRQSSCRSENLSRCVIYWFGRDQDLWLVSLRSFYRVFQDLSFPLIIWFFNEPLCFNFVLIFYVRMLFLLRDSGRSNRKNQPKFLVYVMRNLSKSKRL